MSLSDYSSAAFAKVGYARKRVSVQLAETEEPSAARAAVAQLRDFFAGRAEVPDKSSILTSLERFISDEIPERRREEVVQAALTRRQRKVARRLGFDVRYQGPWVPEA